MMIAYGAVASLFGWPIDGDNSDILNANPGFPLNR